MYKYQLFKMLHFYFTLITIVLIPMFLFISPSLSKTTQVSEMEQELLGKNKKWVGGYNGMIERRVIRVLMPYSKTFESSCCNNSN